MTNYPYIIAGLPDFRQDFGQQQFDYDSLVSFIKEQCSAKDNALIDIVVESSGESGVNAGLYERAAGSGNGFVRDFFAFDRNVRNAKVAFLEGKPYEGTEFDGQNELTAIFGEKNLIERERKLDRLYWEKSEELVLTELFSIDIVLSFLVRAGIVRRWNRLDPVAGAELFERFVQEVRGTFKGVEYNPETK